MRVVVFLYYCGRCHHKLDHNGRKFIRFGLGKYHFLIMEMIWLTNTSGPNRAIIPDLWDTYVWMAPLARVEKVEPSISV